MKTLIVTNRPFHSPINQAAASWPLLLAIGSLLAFHHTAASQSCPNIAGDYAITETAHVGGSCTVQITGTVRITQIGCSVTLDDFGLTASGCPDVLNNTKSCYGSINGNTITLDGTFYYPLPSPVVPDSETSSAHGTITGNTIKLSGSGSVTLATEHLSWSSSATLTKMLDLPIFTTQPSNQTVYAGATVSFAVAAVHRLPFTCQWLKDGKPLPGQTSTILTLTNVGSAQAGKYSAVLSNYSGSTDSGIAQLTVKPQPAPAPPWVEDWEAVSLGSYTPSSNGLTCLSSPRGCWSVGDTISNFSDCGPTQNRADIISDNGRNLLKLVSAHTDSDCAGNIWIVIDKRFASSLRIPLLPTSRVSFFEQGLMIDPQWNGSFPTLTPPAADSVYLKITDNRSNQVAYICQRASNYLEHAITNGPSPFGYLEVFLDPAGGTFDRDLYHDLVRIAGIAGPGDAIQTIEFSITAEGSAQLDDLIFTSGPQPARTSPFTLTISGNGTVSPNLNGQLLQIGSTQTITATPTTGNLFTGWTGDIVAPTPKLTFIMQSNMVLHANFITNSFIAVKGSYYGLFSDSNGVQQASSGFFSSTVTATKFGSAFSAKFQIGSTTSSLSGAFGLSGHAHGNITRRNANPLTVDLQLSLTPGADQLTGTISDGSWTANLSADRAVFNKANPCPFAAKYTLLLPGLTENPPSALGDQLLTIGYSAARPDPAAPRGDSFGTLTIDASGIIKFAGSLADNTPISQSVPISKNGEWPLYIPLYKGKGSLQSWISFTNPPEFLLTGLTSWIKTADPKAKYYPLGFSNEVVALGAIYHPPTNNPAISLTTGNVIFSGAKAPAPFTNQFILRPGNKISNGNTNKFTITIALPSGSFSGSVTPPGIKNATSFKGVLLQNQNLGRGYFLSTNQSGAVFLGPVE